MLLFYILFKLDYSGVNNLKLRWKILSRLIITYALQFCSLFYFSVEQEIPSISLNGFDIPLFFVGIFLYKSVKIHAQDKKFR